MVRLRNVSNVLVKILSVQNLPLDEDNSLVASTTVYSILQWLVGLVVQHLEVDNGRSVFELTSLYASEDR